MSRCRGVKPEEGSSGVRSALPSTPRHLDTSTPSSIADIPLEDPAVYDMLGHADTIGVFQVESRAQMSMLPRLRPREFYDLVVEVAIVRPGPIQGGMVHPYLKRRSGEERVEYPRPEIEEVLGRTLGVPIFQEQAMRLAIVAGGFTADEADALRRAMAAWKRKGDKIAGFGERLIRGMLERGYPRWFAERCFEQIKGFSEYGFPESHAASFAILVYASAWLKRYHPAAFAAALINSQPMGFYQPAQIVRDAREHGVEVRPVDVNASGWDCTLEERCRGDEGPRGRGGKEAPSEWGKAGPALRLGMRLVKGLGESEAGKIVEAVERRGPFASMAALWRASGCTVSALRRLARADAFGSMGLDRQSALWAVKPLRDEAMPLLDEVIEREMEAIQGEEREGACALPAIRPGRKVLQDYGAVGLSLKAHPVRFIRERLNGIGVTPARLLGDERVCPGGQEVAVAGVVLVRQRPATASGVVFFTLEDETGVANLVVWGSTFEAYRKVARLSAVLLARGRIEREGEVVHVHVRHLESLDSWIPGLGLASRDFH